MNDDYVRSFTRDVTTSEDKLPTEVERTLLDGLKCLSRQLLRLEVKGCHLTMPENCDECGDDFVQLYMLIVLYAGYLANETKGPEVEKLKKLINKRCRDCNGC